MGVRFFGKRRDPRKNVIGEVLGCQRPQRERRASHLKKKLAPWPVKGREKIRNTEVIGGMKRKTPALKAPGIDRRGGRGGRLTAPRRKRRVKRTSGATRLRRERKQKREDEERSESKGL